MPHSSRELSLSTEPPERSSASFMAPIVLGTGVLVCILLIALGDLSSRESAMLSLILTALSVLASWSLAVRQSRIEASEAIDRVQEVNQTNLRTFALKAAEKVTTLSNELTRLSLFLEEELSSIDFNTSDEALLSRDQRIVGTVHHIRSLKAFNDGSLSDWQGVIGEELLQKREEILETEARIKDMLADLVTTASESPELASTGSLRAELDLLRSELQSVALGIPAPTRAIGKKFGPLSRSTVRLNCPECSRELVFKQRPRHRNVKAVFCKACNSRLLSKYTAGQEFVLERREARKENVKCPGCGTGVKVQLDSAPGSSVAATCSHCKSSLRLARGHEKVKTHWFPESQSPNDAGVPLGIDRETLSLVRHALPQQPWPKGIHKQVAKELQISTSIVSKCIKRLINSGVFEPQVDGQIRPRPEPKPPGNLYQA